MNELATEPLLTLREAAATIPGSPHVSTLHRWRRRGVRGAKLETCLVGGKRFTSLQAVQRFVRATTIAAEEKSFFKEHSR